MCQILYITLYFQPSIGVIDENVNNVIKEICEEISKRYEINFLKIETDKDYVHFLIQSVNYSLTQIVRIVKSIIAKEVFAKCPGIKKKLWEVNSGQMDFM